MINFKIHLKKSNFFNILAFIALWYFYFSSSFILRPAPQLVWILLAMISLICAAFFKYKIKKLDRYFMLTMLVLMILSIFSSNPLDSILLIFNYCIYFTVARFISSVCSSKSIYKMIMFFSLVHLVCIFIQVFIPDLYISVILPFLPSSMKDDILFHMNYNSSYYGFSVQTSMSAMYLSIGAILSMVEFCYSTRNKFRFGYLLLTILFMIGTFFTVRRGSTVLTLFIIMMIYYKSSGNKISKFLFILSFILFILIIGFENIPGLGSILNKFKMLSESDSLLNGRDVLFKNAFDSFCKKPFLGYGLGQISVAMGYSWLENSYLLILVECGIIGFIVFFFPYIFAFKSSLLKYRNISIKSSFLIFSIYIQIFYFLMSLIENYLALPLNIFLFYLFIFVGEKQIHEKMEVFKKKLIYKRMI